jgi:phospholipid/cholesterol/gamma-HCH transport system permease protein
MLVAVLWQGCRPRNWRRTVVEEFLRQCYSVGIGSMAFILLSGVLIGLAMIFQFLYWLGLVGQQSIVGEIIVIVMIREIAPLLVAMIIVGRSGSVNMVELGQMRTNGQLRLLDAQGVDIFLFLIIPRCLATAVATFYLTIMFILCSLLTGYVGGRIVQPSDTTLIEFFNQVLAAMGAGEYAIVALKPLIIGLIVTLITCTTGMSVDGSNRQLADVLPLGFVKSILAVFLISGTLSVLF